MINHFTFTSFLGFKIHTTILVTASAMPTELKIKPMPNANGIGQTALDGIENAYFGGF